MFQKKGKDPSILSRISFLTRKGEKETTKINSNQIRYQIKYPVVIIIHQKIMLNGIFIILFIPSLFQPITAFTFVVQTNGYISKPSTSFLWSSITPPSISSSDNNNNSSNKPSIAIIGSGAVGCYYGGRLWETKKYDIKFHMRNDHYITSKQYGLNITSVNGDIYIPPNELQTFDKTEDIGHVDWVIMALKSTGVQSTPELILPLLHEHTRVLCIMNGMVDEDIIRLIEGEDNEDVEPTLTKCAAVYAGMALLCSNRIAPGHVDHSYAGKLTASLIKSSSNDKNDIQNHEEMIKELWEPTHGFEFVYDPNYVKARWTKNVWNLPFNGISVAMNGITVDKIVNDPGLRRLAYAIMDETIAIANKDLEARGYTEKDFLGESEVSLCFCIHKTYIMIIYHFIVTLTIIFLATHNWNRKQKKQMMDLSDAMGPYRTSTMLDLTNRRPMEVKYLFRKAIDRANKLSVPSPTLETIVTFIEALQRFHKL